MQNQQNQSNLTQSHQLNMVGNLNQFQTFQNVYQSNYLSQENGGCKQNDNIQKAIDNLKHFIKGSFPKQIIEQNKLIQSKTNNIQNTKQVGLGMRPQTTSNMSNQVQKREQSEDPRAILASSFYHKQNKEALKMTLKTEDEDTDAEDTKRRNPHEPIPAFTSIDIAKKMRYKSEDRYINDRMEKELKAYQGEIEKRFQKSSIKDFTFPRIQNQAPVFFQTMSDLQQQKTLTYEDFANQKQESNKYKQNQFLSIQNKDSASLDTNINDLNSLVSPQSPYGYKQIDLNQQKPQGTNYSINDYKRILSQFLSTGNGPQSVQQSKENSKTRLNYNYGQSVQATSSKVYGNNQSQISSHNRSQSSKQSQNNLVSQKALSNARQTLQESVNKGKHKVSLSTSQNNYNRNQHMQSKHGSSTFVDSSIGKVYKGQDTSIENQHRPVETEVYQDFQDHIQMTEIDCIGDPDFFGIEKADQFNGLVDKHQSNGLLSSQLKTFDYSNIDKASHNHNANSLSGYLQIGSSNKISQQARKNLVNAKADRKLRDNTLVVNDNKINQTKQINKASDYFKTFYNKPTSKDTKIQDRQAKHQAMQNNNQENQNPFITVNSTQSTAAKQYISNKSICGKLSQPQIIQGSSQNLFQMQVNLKSMAYENNIKTSTRNNKLTSGTGMHVRAKTTSDFDPSSTATSAKLKAMVQNIHFENQTNLPQQQYQQTRQSDNLQTITKLNQNNTLLEQQYQNQLNTINTEGKRSAVNFKQSKIVNHTSIHNIKKKENRKPNGQVENSVRGNHRSMHIDDLKQLKSLKLQKNTQILDQRSTACNGLSTERHNPYINQTKSLHQNQLIYSHRDPTTKTSQKRDLSNSSDHTIKNNSLSRSSCPYSDNLQAKSLLSSQGSHHQVASSVYDLGNSQSNHIYTTFTNQGTTLQAHSAKTTIRKKSNPKKSENSRQNSQHQSNNMSIKAQMARSNSKRDFKVKCMKIDLSKQLEYCNTEASQ
eukprot:403336690